MKRWEYDTIRLAPGDMAQLSKHLSEAGQEGWEAFAVVPNGPNHQVYLKRQLTTEPTP